MRKSLRATITTNKSAKYLKTFIAFSSSFYVFSTVVSGVTNCLTACWYVVVHSSAALSNLALHPIFDPTAVNSSLLISVLRTLLNGFGNTFIVFFVVQACILIGLPITHFRVISPYFEGVLAPTPPSFLFSESGRSEQKFNASLISQYSPAVSNRREIIVN